MFYERRPSTPDRVSAEQAERIADAAADARIITRSQAADFKRCYAARLERDSALRRVETEQQGHLERLVRSPLVPIVALIALAFLIQLLLGAAIL